MTKGHALDQLVSFLNSILFVGYQHLLDHNYCERQPPTKRSRPDSDSEEEGGGFPEGNREGEVFDSGQRQEDYQVEDCGHDEIPEAGNCLERGCDTATMTSGEIIQKQQWCKIQDSEQQNALLRLRVKDLQNQLVFKIGV